MTRIAAKAIITNLFRSYQTKQRMSMLTKKRDMSWGRSIWKRKFNQVLIKTSLKKVISVNRKSKTSYNSSEQQIIKLTTKISLKSLIIQILVQDLIIIMQTHLLVLKMIDELTQLVLSLLGKTCFSMATRTQDLKITQSINKIKAFQLKIGKLI